jgi:osmotically-inducible protein OsmY
MAHGVGWRGGRVARWGRLAALVAVLLGAASGCSLRDPWGDARIESEVKARLVAETSANLTRLGVVSREAVVHLSGTVASAEERALAERLARDVTGVQRVVNALDVRPATARPRS